MIVKDINTNLIKIQENIRIKDNDQNIPELMQSIKDNGLLEPIGVKKINDKEYILIWGYRRLQAFKKLDWKSIPAVIFLNENEMITEEDFFILNATENLQRRQNSLLEFGRICKILRKKLSVGEISKRLSIPKSRITNALTEYSRVPIKWQPKIRIIDGNKEKEGDIPLSIASKIACTRGITKEHRDKLYEHASYNEANSTEITAIASLMKAGFSFKEAKDKVEEYRTISFRFLVKKSKLTELRKDYKSDLDLFIKALNSLAKDDSFCFKSVSKS